MELWGLLDNSIEELRYVEGFAIANVHDAVASIVKSVRNYDRSLNKKLSQFIHREEENIPETDSVSQVTELLEETAPEISTENVVKPGIPTEPQTPTKPGIPTEPPTEPQTPTEPPTVPPTQPTNNPTTPTTNPPFNPYDPYGSMCYSGVDFGNAGFNQVGLEPPAQVFVGLSDQLNVWAERAVDYLANKKYFAYNEQSRRVNYKNSFQLPYGTDDICIPVSMQIPYARNSEGMASPYTEEGENMVREKFGVSTLVSRIRANSGIYQYQSNAGYLPTGLADVEPQLESWDFIPPSIEQ